MRRYREGGGGGRVFCGRGCASAGRRERGSGVRVWSGSNEKSGRGKVDQLHNSSVKSLSRMEPPDEQKEKIKRGITVVLGWKSREVQKPAHTIAQGTGKGKIKGPLKYEPSIEENRKG